MKYATSESVQILMRSFKDV